MSDGKGKVVAGVFIGMVLGIAAAGGVAWYVLQKKATSFTNKDQVKPAPQVAQIPANSPVVAPSSAPVAASGVGEAKQHFEFYKVLTDKPDAAARKNIPKTVAPKEPAVAKAQSVPSAPASKEMYYVQAGSFQNEGDAEKLKAKLAFSGFEASIQKVAIPEKGEWHRVRLGPYNNSEAGKTIAALKQNGIIATQLHAQ
ncbi:cell division protein FtsN [mine drainage metagenome]|uniref:Cell division protein FtsN n=1 Tax=mine drainage metagenome TaxID=410659 RepID=A0A1J5T2K1_9ZZZZ